jgi:hypothetical protein
VDKTDGHLEALLRALEEELIHPNPQGLVRRELDEVVWELERRAADRRRSERRQANIDTQRESNAPSIAVELGVGVHGGPSTRENDKT